VLLPWLQGFIVIAKASENLGALLFIISGVSAPSDQPADINNLCKLLFIFFSRN